MRRCGNFVKIWLIRHLLVACLIADEIISNIVLSVFEPTIRSVLESIVLSNNRRSVPLAVLAPTEPGLLVTTDHRLVSFRWHAPYVTLTRDNLMLTCRDTSSDVESIFSRSYLLHAIGLWSALGIVVCLSVTLCIVALRARVWGWKLYRRVPSRQLPIHFFRHYCSHNTQRNTEPPKFSGLVYSQ